MKDADQSAFDGIGDIDKIDRDFASWTHFRHQRTSQFCSDVDFDSYQGWISSI